MIFLKDINKIYNAGKSNEAHVLKNINLNIEQGDMVSIIGTSGAGKSTLLHILACIDEYSSGEYWLDNSLISKSSGVNYAKIRNQKIGIVLQDFLLIEEYSVLQNVITPLLFSNVRKYKKRKEMAIQALKDVGIASLINCDIRKLSGGQKQRVAIARAIVNSPKIILADEPTGSLDMTTSQEIMELFKMLNQSGTTIIIVTHDHNIAACCKRQIAIENGIIITDTKTC